MTEVFFYIIDNTELSDRLGLACKVAARACLTHQVYIHTDDSAHAETVSRYLWQSPPQGFVPHLMRNSDQDHAAAPVLIGYGDCPGDHHQVLINMSTEIPDFYSRFQRVAELVSGAENDRQRSRHRWKHYKDRGYTVKAHQLGWMQFHMPAQATQSVATPADRAHSFS